MIPSEHEEQCALFRWAKGFERLYPELRLLNGSLNGVRLTIGQARKAKAAGMKAGYPDLFLPVPRQRKHGLYIELKRLKGGRLADKQQDWINALRDHGYKAIVCQGFDAARLEILKYLGYQE